MDLSNYHVIFDGINLYVYDARAERTRTHSLVRLLVRPAPRCATVAAAAATRDIISFASESFVERR